MPTLMAFWRPDSRVSKVSMRRVVPLGYMSAYASNDSSSEGKAMIQLCAIVPIAGIPSSEAASAFDVAAAPPR